LQKNCARKLNAVLEATGRKQLTPKLKTRESNAELTPSCVQQGRESPFLLTQYPKLTQKKEEPKNKKEKRKARN
jgi:hypothetical protein